MVARAIIICDSCNRNFRQFQDDDMDDKWTCDAFPDGIPIEILSGFDHRERFGNEELLYEQSGTTADLLETYELNKERFGWGKSKSEPVKMFRPSRKKQ